MKTHFFSLLAVLILLVCIDTAAQIAGTNKNPKVESSTAIKSSVSSQANTTPSSGSILFRNELKGVKSKIFLGENWPLGTIVLQNGSIIDNYNLRYNILADQMQFIAAGDTLAFANPTEIQTVMFDGHSFVYCTYVCDNSLKQGFFEILEHGRNKLLLKRMVMYHIEDVEKADKDGDYLVENCFFIEKGNSPAEKIACNKKKALNVLSNHAPEIKSYMKKTGNKVKTVDDLRKLVAYYNSLEE